jgi:tetratricopeptide (TPR) repeat protein
MVVGCLDDALLLDFMEGHLDAAARASVYAHLESCAACEELFLLTARSFVRSQDAGSTGSVPRVWAAPVLLLPGARVGRYTILDLLGFGGMGVVYAAYDPELDRRVAIKFVRDDVQGGEAGGARLLREAQAMARLSHPNVVVVYEAGRHDGAVFVVMECVDGRTLKEWLGGAERGWQDVVTVFMQAGRGLLAAHQAGLVHRDFKPDNVLVTAAGRACVSDFGLATSGDGELAGPVGTPPYMAPEQRAGGVADARADQFSYCVALYEALYREHPFAGSSRTVRAAPRGTRVPARVRRVLVRGLDPDHEQRWSSMQPLLRALAGAARGQIKRHLWLPAFAVALLMLGWVGHRVRASAPPCAGVGGQVASVWNDAAKQAVHTAIVRTGGRKSADTWTQLLRAIDEYAQSWSAESHSACEATRVKHEQSEQLLDLRTQCMEGGLVRLGAFLDLLGHADAQMVGRAVAAAAELPGVEGCRDAKKLYGAAATSNLNDPRTRALAARLAEIDARMSLGRFQQALEQARAILPETVAAGALPLEAQARSVIGKALCDQHDPAGERAVRDAIVTAHAAGDDQLAGEGWTQLTYTYGYRGGRYAEGLEWARYAEAIAKRLNNAHLLGRVTFTRGMVLWDAGRHDEALAASEQAVKSLRERHVTGWPLVTSLWTCGVMYHDTQRYEDAVRVAKEALAIAEATGDLGDRRINLLLYMLGTTEHGLGHLDRALEYLRRAQAIESGGDDPNTAVDNVLAKVLMQLGRMSEAEQVLTHAIAVSEKKDLRGDPNHDLGELVRTLGVMQRWQGLYEQSLVTLDRATRLFDDHNANPKPDRAWSWYERAETLRAMGRAGEAADLHTRGLPLLATATASAGPGGLAEYQTALAKDYVALGQPARALPLLRKASELVAKVPLDPATVAAVRVTLGRALVLMPDAAQRAEGARLIAEGRAALVALGAPGRIELGELTAWESTQRLRVSER